MHLPVLASIAPPRPNAVDQDAHVANGVRAYCQRHGYDSSTTQGAIAWGLRSPGSTLKRAADGCKRADVLHQRAQPTPVLA